MIFFPLILNFAIFCSIFSACMKYEVPPDEKAVNAAMSRNSHTLAKKYHMHPFGVTVAMPEGDIQYLELEFQIQGPLPKQEIRQLLINVAHDFLADINSDAELCAYLKNHSLTIKDIGIGLFLIDSARKSLNDPVIGIAKISRGALRYLTLVTNNIRSIKSEYDESYEEASNILNS